MTVGSVLTDPADILDDVEHTLYFQIPKAVLDARTCPGIAQAVFTQHFG